MSSKVCIACKIEKEVSEFRTWLSKNGEIRYTNYCKPCKNKRSDSQKSDETRLKTAQYKKEKNKFERKNLINVERFILEDTRKDDKKRGLDNDLTKEFIRDFIKNGCQYCGETEMRITLDRIDNTKGHTKDNCMPACLRCNNIRNSMPYVAWVELVPAIRMAKEKGVFGNWVGGIKQFLL